MQDNSNFFEMLVYNEIPQLDNYDREHALREISYYINYSNGEAYDIINYERLMYIELKFIDDKEVQMELLKLKQYIVTNFVLKERLLSRLQLKGTICNSY